MIVPVCARPGLTCATKVLRSLVIGLAVVFVSACPRTPEPALADGDWQEF